MPSVARSVTYLSQSMAPANPRGTNPSASLRRNTGTPGRLNNPPLFAYGAQANLPGLLIIAFTKHDERGIVTCDSEVTLASRFSSKSDALVYRNDLTI